MLYSKEQIGDLTKELFNSEEYSFLRNIKENWSSFTNEDKKRAICIDNLKSVFLEDKFRIKSGTYLRVLRDYSSHMEEGSSEVELQNVFNDPEIPCEGCELGVCFYTLVKYDNKFKFHLFQFRSDSADQLNSEFFDGSLARRRLLELYTQQELALFEAFFEAEDNFLNGLFEGDERFDLIHLVEDFGDNYGSASRFIIINYEYAVHGALFVNSLNKYA